MPELRPGEYYELPWTTTDGECVRPKLDALKTYVRGEPPERFGLLPQYRRIPKIIGRIARTM